MRQKYISTQSIIFGTLFQSTIQFHVLIGSVMLVLLGLGTREPLAAEETISNPTVLITDQKGEIHGTASFIGNRGYLLTVLAGIKPGQLPAIGEKFRTYYVSNGQRREVSAAVVDINHDNGISLLRLTNTTYPNDKPLLTSESMQLPFDLKDKHPCKVYFPIAVAPYIDNKGCEIVATSDDGTIRINLTPSFKTPKAGMGAPVYADDKLIGLVYSWGEHEEWAKVYPINHAISYLMMAEGTILGKDTLLRIMEQAGLVEQLQNFLETVRMHPKVEIKIDSDPLSLVVRIRRPYNIEYDPVAVTAEAYPIWSYPLNGIPTRVTWSESKKLEIKDDLKVIESPAVVLRYSNVRGKQSKEDYPSLCDVKLRLLKAMRYAGLKDTYSNTMQATKIESFHVSYSWEVLGKNGNTVKYMEEATFPVEDVYCPRK